MPGDTTSAAGNGPRARSGDHWLPLVYRELRALAACRLARLQPGQTLQTTALVHEAWLRLARTGEQTWENQGHFFAAASEAMRRILVENARRKSRLKRGGHQEKVDIDLLELAGSSPDDKVLLVDEVLARLEVEDAKTAQLVVLKFYGGLTNQEIATMWRTSERTVERNWAYARAWLYRAIQKEL